MAMQGEAFFHRLSQPYVKNEHEEAVEACNFGHLGLPVALI
jgi:hypothetical protein